MRPGNNPLAISQALRKAEEFRSAGRLREAEATCQDLLTRYPDSGETLHFLGVACAQQGRLQDAIDHLAASLDVAPHSDATLANLILVYNLAGRHDEARLCAERALQLFPNRADILNNYGLALQKLNQPEKALEQFSKAVEVDTRFAEAWNNKGNVLLRLRRHQEAIDSYLAAIRKMPRYPAAHSNLASAYQAIGRLDEALRLYDQALQLDPAVPDTWIARSAVHWKLKRFEESIRDIEQAAALKPDADYALGTLIHRRMQVADWRDFHSASARLDEGVRKGERIVDPFAYQAISESPADLLACAKTYASHHYPASAKWRARAVFVPRNRKIRIGYVSGEFCDQATAYLTAGLYEKHDRAKFEIIAFDNGHDDKSATRARMALAFDEIVSIGQLSDDEAADRIAQAGIDILVNLNGYFGAERTGIFARRPAPIQVNYLAFPGTMGAAYMDYIIADPIVVPESEDAFFSEAIVRMPGTYQVCDDSRVPNQRDIKRADYGLPADRFVFCNFNQSYKLTPDTFACWMRILQRAKNSVLWLLEDNPIFSRNIRSELQRNGIAQDRLHFASPVANDLHLARISLADLALDTWPYNSHTGANDALWGGTPILTLTGTAFAGRVATSLLHALGMPELAVVDIQAYEDMAVALALDEAACKSLRRKLSSAESRRAFDTAAYCSRLEFAYCEMWNSYLDGKPRQHFKVPALL